MIAKHDPTVFEKLDMFVESKIIIKKNEWEVNDNVFRSNVKLIKNTLGPDINDTTQNLVDDKLLHNFKKKFDNVPYSMSCDKNTGVQLVTNESTFQLMNNTTTEAIKDNISLMRRETKIEPFQNAGFTTHQYKINHIILNHYLKLSTIMKI